MFATLQKSKKQKCPTYHNATYGEKHGSYNHKQTVRCFPTPKFITKNRSSNPSDSVCFNFAIPVYARDKGKNDRSNRQP